LFGVLRKKTAVVEQDDKQLFA